MYELTGQQNSFNASSVAATESTITSYYYKKSGMPLQLSFGSEFGSLFGTVSANFGISAIDWSDRVGP